MGLSQALESVIQYIRTPKTLNFSHGISLKCELPRILLGLIGGLSRAPSIDAPKRIFGFRFDRHRGHLVFGVTKYVFSAFCEN